VVVSEVQSITIAEFAVALRDGFLAYNAAFRAVTQRAKRRFEQRDWHAGQRDAEERIDLYDLHIGQETARMREMLGDRLNDQGLWARIKLEFAEVTVDLPDVEFAKTWFSSVTRKVFDTVGVHPDIEFVEEENIPLRNASGPLVSRNFTCKDTLEKMFADLLDDYAWDVPFAEPDRCASRIAVKVRAHYRTRQKSDTVLCVDMIGPVFYRTSRAYVIGRVTGWTRTTPIAIVFKNTDEGVVVDAVVLTERGVRVMFGFACSYFHVDLDPVGPAVLFLHEVMPRHMMNELFTVLGRAKQGKTERFRALTRHLRFSADEFIVAPGKKGMVMAVFTLPSFEVVFKLMRDRFAPPKEISHDEVQRRYRMVVHNNKSGRLVDAQEFRMLRFDRRRFDPDLLEELLGECGDRVHLDGDSVVIRHVYVERRLRPLDLYLREVEPEDAMRAVMDYGQALRDLAATNVFPGDLLTKNFGVSSTGRVIFYDYDEVQLLTDCNFRAIPEPRCYEDEVAAEPWFSVGRNDIFPEEFPRFLGLSNHQMEAFLVTHGELFTPAFWRGLQARHRAGEVLEVLPY
jgi:isocitrate dehydrogenase kinase/phosphatase